MKVYYYQKVKISFTFWILISSLIVAAQDESKDFFQNRCDFKSDGMQKALGLKITLSVPCKWVQTEGRRPHVLENFTYHFSDRSYITSQLLVEPPYKGMEGATSMKDVNDNFLGSLWKQYGTVTGIRRTKIGGLPAAEFMYIGKIELPIANVYMFQLTYMILYNRKLITITYTTGAEQVNVSKELSQQYQSLFKHLAGQAIINNVFQ